MENVPNTARKVIALIRVSSQGQAKDDRNGVERQRAYIDRHCKAFNLEVVKTVSLVVSGAYVQDSPDYQAMLRQLPQLSIAGVVTATIDRFFRPADMWQAYHETLTPFVKSGKRLFCDIGELNPADDMDMMKLFFQGEGAKIERRRIKERTGFALDSNRVRGDKKPTALPKGIGFKDGKFFYTADSAKVYKAFELMAAGKTICEVKNTLGYATQTALRVVLRNPWWVGIKSSFTTKGTNGIKAKRANPILVETNLTAAPLVPRATFDTVQDILGEHTTTWTKQKSHTKQFLAHGILKCECGAPMYVVPNHDKVYAYYKCANRHRIAKGLPRCEYPTKRIDQTDKELRAKIRRYLSDSGFLALKIGEAMNTEHANQLAVAVEAKQKLVADLDRKKSNLMRLAEDVGYTPELGARLKTLNDQQTQTRNDIRTIQSEISSQGVDVMAVAAGLAVRFMGFDTLGLDEQKALLAECVESVSYDTNGRIKFAIRAGLPPEVPARNERGEAHKILNAFGETLSVQQTNYVNLEMHSYWPA